MTIAICWSAVEQSYIDHLKTQVGEDKSANYSQELKQKLSPEKESDGYSEKIKAKALEDPKSTTDGYTDKVRTELTPAEPGGAIDAVNAGRSELKLKRPGKIRGAGGIRIGTAMLNRNIKAGSDVQQRQFKDVYGNKWVPDLNIYGEWKPLYHEWIASVGLIGGVGISSYRGRGLFEHELTNASTGGSFGETSRVEFNFNVYTFSLGGNVRLNTLQIVRPFVSFGPAVAIYTESRNDGKPSVSGNSRGYFYSLGAALMLDWISSSAAWAMYDSFGIKHFYITAEYTGLETISGPVDFNTSGLFSGLSFEF
jgi:hypothetical protein